MTEPSQHHQSMIRILKKLVWLKPFYFISVSLLFFIENILEGFGLALIVPIFYRVLGEGGGNSSFAWLEDLFQKIGISPSIEVLLGTMILLFFVRALIMYASKRYISNFSGQILQGFQEGLVKRFLQGNLHFFQSNKQGELINSVVTESNRAALSFLYLSQWISFVFSVFLYLTLAFYVSPLLTAMALAVGGLFFYPLRYITSECERIGNRSTKVNGELQNDLQESFSLIKFIKAAHYESVVKERVNKKISEFRENWSRTYFLSGAIQIFSNPIGVVILCVVIYVGRELTVASPDLIVFLVAFQRLLPSYTSVQNLKNNLYFSVPGLENILELMKSSVLVAERESGKDISNFRTLEMKDVVFEYSEGQRVLDRINLKIDHGQMTAIVGLSGQGKTTLVDTLIGFYQIKSGSYTINGCPLGNLSLASWRSKISYVTQDTFLFHDSIRNNILFGQKNISGKEIRHYIKLCHAEFIYDFENGMDTIVGDRGSKLSGGQRQRIALVRALIRKPEVLILDEATSSLDTESEFLIKSTLGQLKRSGEITIILIAHRLETVKIADQILVINEGQIFERGSWQELSGNVDTFFHQKLILNH